MILKPSSYISAAFLGLELAVNDPCLAPTTAGGSFTRGVRRGRPLLRRLKEDSLFISPCLSHDFDMLLGCRDIRLSLCIRATCKEIICLLLWPIASLSISSHWLTIHIRIYTLKAVCRLLLLVNSENPLQYFKQKSRGLQWSVPKGIHRASLDIYFNRIGYMDCSMHRQIKIIIRTCLKFIRLWHGKLLSETAMCWQYCRLLTSITLFALAAGLKRLESPMSEISSSDLLPPDSTSDACFIASLLARLVCSFEALKGAFSDASRLQQ